MSDEGLRIKRKVFVIQVYLEAFLEGIHTMLNHGLGFINAVLGLGKSFSNNRMGTTRIGIREGDFWGRVQGVELIYWVNRHPWYSRLNPCYASEARLLSPQLR